MPFLRKQRNGKIKELEFIPLAIINNFNIKMKKWFSSRTIWVALIQGVSGVMMAFLAQDPTLSDVGWFLTVKSGLDIFLRFITTSEIK